MNFKRDILYNLIIYPIISLLNIKKYLFTSYPNTRNILDSCSENILHHTKYKTEGRPPIQKGWIVTNNKSIYSIVFDNYSTHSAVLLKFREVFDLLFYGLVMYWGGRIVILTKYSVDRIVEKFDEGMLERILLYYPQDINIFYQIYTKSPDIPVQILITANKECEATYPKIRIFSEPIMPRDYENFVKFMEKVVEVWSETSLQCYAYEKRFIEEKC